MIKRRFWIIICLFVLVVTGFGGHQSAMAQNDTLKNQIVIKDTAKIESVILKKRLSPRRAGLLSAAIPGLGQVYNKKYWKLPIIYVGGAVLGYYIYANNLHYSYYRDAIEERGESVTATESVNPPDYAPFATRLNLNMPYYNTHKLSKQQLATQREYHRRNRDLLIIVSMAFYALNIADAIVDAHLADFDVSDNLSLHFEPSSMPMYAHTAGNKQALGFSMKMNFR